MRVRVEIGDIARWEDEVVVVNLFDGVRRPGGATGAVDAALGHQISAMIGTGDLTGVWREAALFPTFDRILWDEYDEQIQSDSADVKNTGGRSGGSITAAKFLQKFAEGLRWAHLDIAGTAWIEAAPDSPKKEYLPKGSSGFGVRLLVRLLRDWKSNT